jgi:hypothetical protein
MERYRVLDTIAYVFGATAVLLCVLFAATVILIVRLVELTIERWRRHRVRIAGIPPLTDFSDVLKWKSWLLDRFEVTQFDIAKRSRLK